jgi:hypothetical protein
VARRKRLILYEFAVTVRENRIDWGGVDRFINDLLQTKPAGGFHPQLRKVFRRELRPDASK